MNSVGDFAPTSTWIVQPPKLGLLVTIELKYMWITTYSKLESLSGLPDISFSEAMVSMKLLLLRKGDLI